MPTTNSIQTIKNYFTQHKGLQLANRFEIDFFNVPSYAGGNVQDIHASDVVLPPRAIETIADSLQGYGSGRFVPRNQKLIPDKAGAGGILLTFPLTNDSFILDFFNRWFNYFYSSSYINPYSGRNYLLPFYDDAVASTQMIVRILNPNGVVHTNVVFDEVFPIESFPVTFSMKSENTYATYQVNLGFREYYYQLFNVNQ